MRALHHLHHFFIRHGKEIYYLMLDMASIFGLLWLCWIFTRWLAKVSPVLIN